MPSIVAVRSSVAMHPPLPAVTVLAGLLLLAGCRAEPASSGPGPVVFAAASLGDAMTEIAAAWVADGGGTPRVNVAGSNVLARQLVAAPGAADVFLSADEAWLDVLDRQGLLAPGSRRTPVANRLAVIAARGSGLRPVESAAGLDALTGRRWVLADPEAVPAGRYARGFLERAGLWDRLAGRRVPAADVRAALALVAADDTLVGIVYRTDAASDERVEVLYAVPAAAAPEIRYGAAALAAAPHPDVAARFLDFLAGPQATAVFQRLGFVTPGDAAP